MPTEIRPEFRTPEQVRADEEIATAHENGAVPAGWKRTEIVPAAERWALTGVLFARHLGVGSGLHPDHQRQWMDAFRRELVDRRPDLRQLLDGANRLTPEIESAVRAAADDFHARFVSGLAPAPAPTRG